MHYVKYIDLFGEPVATIPCIVGSVAPTAATFGKVGCLYMNDKNGGVYACTAAADGTYTWVPIAGGSGASEVLFVEYGKTPFTEMEEAIKAGKLLICKSGNFYAILYDWHEGKDMSFRRFSVTECINYYCIKSSGWGNKTTPLQDTRLQELEERIYALEQTPITFYIDGTAYTAQFGMTWQRFCDSEYNPIVTCEECGGEQSEFGIGVREEGGVTIIGCCTTHKNVGNASGDMVYAYDAIIAGHNYQTIE